MEEKTERIVKGLISLMIDLLHHSHGRACVHSTSLSILNVIQEELPKEEVEKLAASLLEASASDIESLEILKGLLDGN